MITGATGFVGTNLVSSLKGHELVLLQRRKTLSPHEVIVSELSPSRDYGAALQGVDVVVHTAALVHHMSSKAAPTEQEYREINSLATARLAECAIDAGVSHFIFLSSVKVNGEVTEDRSPFSAVDLPNPQDAYARSKLEAESRLFDLRSRSDMRISVIRAPLVYGPQVKANFSRLLRFANTGFPFPKNDSAGKRSLVSIWNLCSFITKLSENPPDESRVYMISDGSDCTSYDLVRYISQVTKGREVGFWFPLTILRWIAIFARQGRVYEKLFVDLRVDISNTLEKTGWMPEHDTRHGITRLVSEIRSSARRDTD